MTAGSSPPDCVEIVAGAAFAGPSVLGLAPMYAFRVRFADPPAAVMARAERDLAVLFAEAEAALRARRCCPYPPAGCEALSGAVRDGCPGLLAATALRLQALLGHGVRSSTVEGLETEGLAIAAFQYRDEAVAVRAGEVAAELVTGIAGHQEVDGESLLARIDRFVEAALKDDLSGQAATLLLEAEARDIPWRRLTAQARVVELGHGHKRRRFRGGYTDRTGYIATMIATNKGQAAEVLQAHGIPMPQNQVVRSSRQAVAAAHRIGFPVVVKPNGKDFGTDVFTGLRDAEQVRQAYGAVRRHGPALVERHIEGEQCRLMVTHGKLAFASEHRPARVIGDGTHSVAELVELVNRDRGETYTYDFFKKIDVDDRVLDHLARQGFDLEAIPPEGQEVRLRSQANWSVGGTGESATERLHPDNRAMAERVARLVGLDVVGIDFITSDVTRPYHETGGTICDINPTPGWTESPQREDSKRILAPFFPAGDDGRIPIVSIVGDAGAGTAALARLVVRLLAAEGHTVGHAGPAGATIDGELVSRDDQEGIAGCRNLLYDPAVTALVLETSLATVAREGLGYDRCAVTVLLPDAEAGGDTPVVSRRRVERLLDATSARLVHARVDDPNGAALAAVAQELGVPVHRASDLLSERCSSYANRP